MRADEYPNPASDPEALGLPGTADDDSTAWDDVDTGRESDGADPAALPPDREDGPLGMDRYGTTPQEQAEGEGLDRKLDREIPDPALQEVSGRPDTEPSPIAAESFDPDAVGEDLDAVDRDTDLEEAPIEPNRDSPVSMYDTGVGGRDSTVGRIVEPDQGSGVDTERDAIAYDAGAAGGGASAEEAALHEIADA
jgi:hypothetical protein